jgi:hypothetical protein
MKGMEEKGGRSASIQCRWGGKAKEKKNISERHSAGPIQVERTTKEEMTGRSAQRNELRWTKKEDERGGLMYIKDMQGMP